PSTVRSRYAKANAPVSHGLTSSPQRGEGDHQAPENERSPAPERAKADHRAGAEGPGVRLRNGRGVLAYMLTGRLPDQRLANSSWISASLERIAWPCASSAFASARPTSSLPLACAVASSNSPSALPRAVSRAALASPSAWILRRCALTSAWRRSCSDCSTLALAMAAASTALRYWSV